MQRGLWAGRISRFLIPGLAYFLGLVFLVAGVSKLFTFGDFVTTVRAYGIFPQGWVPPLAAVLIGVEICVGGLFFIRGYQALAGGVAGVLLTGFIALAVYARASGIETDCGYLGL